MDTFLKLLFLVVFLATVWGVVLGWTGEAVFFMDKNDLMLSFLGWMALVAGIFLGVVLEWGVLAFIGAIGASYFAYESVRHSFVHNNQDWRVGLPVGIGKVMLSCIYIAAWMEVLTPGGKTVSQRNASRATAMIIIGLLSLLFAKLVNGPDVLARRAAVAGSNPP